ncbi:MAG: dephospho-CoA kinase [Pseudomonadota bacterium]|jgi:dephospho-CoA kinase
MATLIGLTGGIGSGKSTVAGILQGFGATVVDADAISRGTTAAGGAAMAAIRESFGADFVDSSGALDRAKMRDCVFSDTSAKQKLEAIVHPLIKQEMQRQIAAATSKLVVLDLPLLAENTGFNGWRAKLDMVCVVDCSPETQIQRVMKRSNMTAEQVLAVMANQATRQARLAIADVVITNEDLTLDALKLTVKAAIIDP